MNKLIRYLTDSDYRFLANSARGWYRSMPDDEYLRRKYRATFGRELDLENPGTFNEKLQWLKLHDRNPLYTQLVDKVAVKSWVAERIGEEYIVPTYAVWDSVEDIDLDALPDKFVLKTNHDSGGVAICSDRATFDFEAAKRKLAASMRRNFYYYNREWPYKGVKPRVFAEQYLEDIATGELPDYKYFCFDGSAKAMFIATERYSAGETKFDFYDMDFNHMPFTNGHPNSSRDIAKPTAFNQMRELAEKLSQDIPQVRVDFYETQAGVYFGELTFSHWGGFVSFDPYEYDELFGSWIELSKGAGEGAS